MIQEKVGSDGLLHRYEKIPARDLREGMHLLERIPGFPKMVATIIIDVRPYPADPARVNITVPDRIESNIPVGLAYKCDEPVFISHTPWREQPTKQAIQRMLALAS